jgi:hypothetical protein
VIGEIGAGSRLHPAIENHVRRLLAFRVLGSLARFSQPNLFTLYLA